MVGRIFLGRYEAVKILGEGGMGRVYLARQVDLGRNVVVKVMHDHIAADELDAVVEAQVIAFLSDPRNVELLVAPADDSELQAARDELVDLAHYVGSRDA